MSLKVFRSKGRSLTYDRFFKATEDLNAKSPGAVYKVTENSGEGQFFGERFVVRKVRKDI